MSKIAGLDIGTTGCKCTVFDENGHFLGKAYRDYPSRRDVSGHEIDASAIMEAVCEVISEMACQFNDIAALGVTSFGETFVMTDEEGNPLHMAMLYTDPRGADECAFLSERFGEREIMKLTGNRPHEMYSISKLMWMKNHCPDLYKRASYVFLMEDFVVFHLTGRRQIDYSLAARTMAFDINKLEWSQEIFEAAGIDVEKMSAPVPTGTSAGVIKREAAERTGLSPGTLIVSVSHDQIAAAVGAGVFDSLTAVDGAGTVECVTPIFDSVPDMETMYKGFFSVVPYVVPGKYAAYAFSYTGGALIQWCVDNLAGGEKAQAEKEGCRINAWIEEEYVRRHGEAPSGLLVLPHFAGAATPYMDTGSKGAILGLDTSVTAVELYRACMEGVVYEMLLNVRALSGSGASFSKMRATGGGARSKEWMQMKADILDMPVTALSTVDAGTAGSAMLTGVAAGVFSDLQDAAAHMVEERETYYPRKAMHEKYMRIYERYEKVYQAVRPLMKER